MTSLFNHKTYNSKVPDDWHLSYIINLFKGNGDGLSFGNYKGLKFQRSLIPSQGNKSLSITCSLVSCQVEVPLMLQEKYLLMKKNIYFAFVDLEKAFDHVHCRNNFFVGNAET